MHHITASTWAATAFFCHEQLPTRVACFLKRKGVHRLLLVVRAIRAIVEDIATNGRFWQGYHISFVGSNHQRVSIASKREKECHKSFCEKNEDTADIAPNNHFRVGYHNLFIRSNHQHVSVACKKGRCTLKFLLEK